MIIPLELRSLFPDHRLTAERWQLGHVLLRRVDGADADSRVAQLLLAEMAGAIAALTRGDDLAASELAAAADAAVAEVLTPRPALDDMVAALVALEPAGYSPRVLWDQLFDDVRRQLVAVLEHAAQRAVRRRR